MNTPNPAHDSTVDLWNCPCRECTRLEWELVSNDIAHEPISLGQFRAEEWPEVYGAAAQEAAATRQAVRDLGYQGPFIATDALPEEPPLS
jgi:hypothetical protein